MRTITITLLQAAVLLGLGVVVGLGANAVRSRDHIRLTRNYAPVLPHGGDSQTDSGVATQRAEPYNLVTLDEVVRIVADSSRFGLDVILDARSERAYGRGHLPGAILCDPYNLERDFDYALNMSLGAERVIIYCHGGNCEDSYLLAQELVGHGVPTEWIYVFKEGWEAWQARQQSLDASSGGALSSAADPSAPAAPAADPSAPPTPATDPPASVTPPAQDSVGIPPAVEETPAPLTSVSPALAPAALSSDAADRGEPVFRQVGLDEVIELFEDHKTTDGAYVFVDARSDGPYEAGHIPGAVQCDFYRIDYYLPDILRRAATAEKFIVYCSNAECEDSLYVCGELLKADIPRARILLFVEGWDAWNAADLPVAGGRDP